MYKLLATYIIRLSSVSCTVKVEKKVIPQIIRQNGGFLNTAAKDAESQQLLMLNPLLFISLRILQRIAKRSTKSLIKTTESDGVVAFI